MVIPGAGQIIDDKTIRGLLLIFAFTSAICLALLIGNLAPLAAPAIAMKVSIRAASIALAVIIWLIALIPILRQRSTA